MEQVDALKILLIDNDRRFLERLRGWLRGEEEASCRITNVERLSDAIRLLKPPHRPIRAAAERPVDAIVLNLSLPDCAGPAGLDRLMAAAPGIPVVVLTTRLSERHAADARNVGAVACLPKDTLAQTVLIDALENAVPPQSRWRLAAARAAAALAGNGRPLLPSRQLSGAGQAIPSAFINQMQEPAYVCRPDGQIISWNDAAAVQYGHSGETATRLHVATLSPVEAGKELAEACTRAASGAPVRGVKSRRRKAKGEPFDVLFSASPVFDAAGDAVAVLFVERAVVSSADMAHTGDGASAETEKPVRSPAAPEVGQPIAWAEDDTRPLVLVVEDNDVSRRMLKRMLDARYRVATAAGPTEALTLAAEQKFDLLLLDISLGDRRTGVELLHALRKAPSYRKVPAVACTAYALPGLSDRLLELGFNGYISKPFGAQTLVETVEAALGHEAEPPQPTLEAESPDLVLPPMPFSLSEVVEMLSDDNGADIERLTGVLENDPVVASWVLHHVNSAFYSLRGNVSSVERAVTLLGFEPICNLVLSKVLARAFSGFDAGKPALVYEYLQRASVATAAFARALAVHLAMPEPELSFTAGLLHQLGRLGLLSMEPERYAGLWFVGDGADEEVPVPPAVGQELLHMGTDNDALGIRIAREWQLPKKLAFVIGRQNKPSSRAVTAEALMALTVSAGSAATKRLYLGQDAFPAADAEMLNASLKVLARRHETEPAALDAFLLAREGEVRELVGKIVAG